VRYSLSSFSSSLGSGIFSMGASASADYPGKGEPALRVFLNYNHLSGGLQVTIKLPLYYSEHKICPYFVTLSEAKGLDSSAPAGPQNDR
jgi:hypothetical protein